jgi:hypothetical protein
VVGKQGVAGWCWCRRMLRIFIGTMVLLRSAYISGAFYRFATARKSSGTNTFTWEYSLYVLSPLRWHALPFFSGRRA